MTVATYVFEVEWDAATFADESARVLSLEWRRGRDYASQLTGRGIAGELIAQLRNPDGRFASFNTTGPLSGNILPARKVRLRTTAPSVATLWQGFLDTIGPGPRTREDEPTATLRANGPLGFVARRHASTGIFTSIATGTALAKILDDAGWPAADRTLDTGQVTMNRWGADGDEALFHLREIEEMEFGFVSESKDGKIVFEDVHHRLKTPHTVSQATFSDLAGAALPYSSIEQLDPWREIFNRFDADVTLFAVQALAVLWTLAGETPSIGAGQSKEFFARYPTPDAAAQADHVDAWTTPAATMDFTANSLADGTGTDLTSQIAVTVAKFANSMKITLTNNATQTAHITLLQARGTAAYKNDPIRIVTEDSASQTKYGKRSFPLSGKFYPSTARAKSFTEYGISRHKDPLPILRIGFQANQSDGHMTQALSRDISERVTVRADGASLSGAQLGINQDFFIESEHHRLDLSGHQVTYELSDATKNDAGFWVLGVSTLGQTTRLVV